MPFHPDLLRYTNTYFIETETGNGTTAKLVSDSGVFKRIYTMNYTQEVKETLKEYTNIFFFEGSSTTNLGFLIKDIEQPITFWLSIANLDIELLQIFYHPVKNHTIIIDGLNSIANQLELLQKLKQINSDYDFKVYKGDILVAITSEKPPLCIKKFPQTYTIPVIPPGVGDILRGSIAMLQHAKKYNYRFCIDRSSHPFWKFFEPSEYLIDYKINDDVKMYITGDHMPGGFEQVHEELEKSFQSGESFTCVTNAFCFPFHGNYEIDQECAAIMRKILRPTEELKSIVLDYYKRLGLSPLDKYVVFHFRFGDVAFQNPRVANIDILKYVVPKIKQIQELNPEVKFVLLTDSEAMGILLKENIPSLFYTNTKRLHLGYLSPSLEGLETTVAELMILINSKTMLTNSRSGFSFIPSLIYSIPYHPTFPYHPVG